MLIFSREMGIIIMKVKDSQTFFDFHVLWKRGDEAYGV